LGPHFLWVIAVTPSTFIADFFGASTGSIYLCSLSNDRNSGRPAEICGRGDSARLDELVLHRWDRPDRGTFFCVNTVTSGQARRSKETVFEIVCLHADLDFDVIDVKPDAVLKRLGQLTCLPSKVIHSGHGYHCYWLLNEALTATSKMVLQVETLLHSLADMLAGDPAVAEVARLMRLPGSFNTKNGERIPVQVIVDRPARYDLDDLSEWIAETRPLIPRKGEPKPAVNPFIAIKIPGAGGPAVDVSARLAAMRHRGSGETGIHQTQLSASAALLSRGVDTEEVVAAILAATRTAAGAEGERWNWAHEEKDIRAMCASWVRKKLNGQRLPVSDCQSGTSMEELGTMEFKPVSFLVPDLIPAEGITLICSKPKVGKSWLLYDLCISAAINRDMLGDRRPAQGHTLYLALEDSLRRLRSRGERLLPAWAGPWPANMRVETVWPRVDQGGLDRIRDWIAGVRAGSGRVACVAIDVLKMIRPAGQDRKAAYDRDYEALSGLRALSHEVDVAFVVTHHTRKAAADDLIDMVSGTLGLSGAADTIVVIERQPSGGYVFDARGRDIEAAQLAATFDRETCRWSITGDASSVRRSAEREAVLCVFREASGPLTVVEVTAALREGVTSDRRGVTKSRDAVKQILGRMAKSGDLRRVEKGRYELPTNPESLSH
jgi:AAA domain-containing protein